MARRAFGNIYHRRWKDKTGVVHEDAEWLIRYRINGAWKYERTGSTDRAVAEALLTRRETEAGHNVYVEPRAKRVTLAQAVKQLEDDYKNNERKSLRRAQLALSKIRTHFGEHRQLAAITDADVEAYKAARLEQGAERASINLELAALRRLYSLNLRVPRPKIVKLKVANARQGFFERGDFEAIRDQLPEPLRPLMEFVYWTGWRKQEVLGLTWAQVDFQGGTVRLEPGTTKNDEGRVLPFSELPDLKAVLEAQRDATDAVERRLAKIVTHVFHRNGKPIRSYDNAWRAACKRAGLLGRIVHDMRRTAVRRYERAGVSRSVATKLTGHKTEAVYRRYAITPEQDLREGLRKVAALPEPAERTVLPIPKQHSA